MRITTGENTVHHTSQKVTQAGWSAPTRQPAARVDVSAETSQRQS